MRRTLLAWTIGFIALAASASAAEKPSTAKPNGNRLTYLDEPCNPWQPHRDFPKLTTPMWVGEEGVEAVVILGIDDMRGHEKWEAYLRPILNRLKQIDGRAPVSIFTCSIDPKQPHLQQWLEEGLSFEVHTIDHPCPLLKDGDLVKAKSTVDRCIDLLNEVPNNKPVCFRTPCCDSLNTLSPRFFTEIFSKTTPKGNFLLADSSVMQVFTSDDPALPRELVLEPDDATRRTGGVSPLVDGASVDAATTRGLTPPVRRERFKKYLPADRFFANSIENYPYPFVVDRLCWEFPCVAPSDWAAQHLHKPNNPKTIEDWKAALDCTVIKQGVFCLVFHPHNWIKPEQINELIDHAVIKHGKKVKFLNFREAVERLNKNVLGGWPLRDSNGFDNGIHMTETYRDGYIDVLIDADHYRKKTPPFRARMWDVRKQNWTPYKTFWPPFTFMPEPDPESELLPSYARLPEGAKPEQSRIVMFKNGLLLQAPNVEGAFKAQLRGTVRAGIEWVRYPFQIPTGVVLPTFQGGDVGLRFIDIDEDGHDDIVFSNHERYGIWLWESLKTGWSREVFSAKRGDKPANEELPPIVRADGSNNGFWVHSRQLVWMNEDTAKSKDLVERRSFDDILARRLGTPARLDQASAPEDKKTENKKTEDGTGKSAHPPEDGPKSPEASLKLMQVKPGYRVELVAAEPLVRDPVAFDWGPDGKLWVAEMADYPLGVGAGEEADNADATLKANGGRQPPGTSTRPNSNPTSGLTPTVRLFEQAGYKRGGGRVRILEDTDGDGQYDKSTVFLDQLNFPNGVMPWRDGVLISAAPEVLFARDTNGDGKADEVKVLLTGFGEGNQQHRVNGFSWGLDNMVHCANGDSGGQIKVIGTVPRPSGSGLAITTRPLPNGRGTDAEFVGKTIDIRGRDFRWNPDTGEIDPTSGQTQFGRNRDDFGNWFGNNNANPMYHFVLDDYYTRRNPHVAPPDPRKHVSITPGTSPVFPISRTLSRFNDFAMANRFTSANSAMVYRDELLFRSPVAPRQESRSGTDSQSPDDSKKKVEGRSAIPVAERQGYIQHVFISEPVHNLVHHEVMTADGVTFTSRRADDEQQSEFLASKDNWFRPTQIKTGPDGALYIADMYRQVIEHPQYIPPAMQEKLDLRAGHDKGRIYRVVPVNGLQRPVKPEDEDEEPIVWPLIPAKPPRGKTYPRFDSLWRALKSPNGTIRDLAHRMIYWQCVDAKDAGWLSLQEVGSSPLASLHVLSITDGVGMSESGGQWREIWVVLQDKDPWLRRRGLQAAERFDGNLPDQVIKQLSGMGRDPDPFVRMQFAYTLGHPKFASLGNELGKLLYRERDDKYLVAAAMSSIHAQNVASVVANVFESAGKDPLPPQLASTLLNLAATLGSDEALLSLIEYVLSGAATSEAQSVMLAQVLETLDRRGTSLNQLKGIAPQRRARVEQQLAERIKAARAEISNFKSQIVSGTALAAGRPTKPPVASAIPLNPKSNAADQASAAIVAALPLLGRTTADRAADAELIGSLLVPQIPATTQSAAIAALSRINHANSATSLLRGWKMLTPGLRQQVLDALLSRVAWTDQLLDQIEAQTISSAEIDAARRQRLVGHTNPTIKARAAKVLDLATNADRQKVVAEYAAKLKGLKQPGDATRGAVVFKERQCAACHKLRDIGTQVGPDLVSLTDKSTAALLTAILDPNNAVEAKYLAYAATTTDGRVVAGMIVAETGNSITLAGTDGKPVTLLRNEIDEFVASNKSFMPEGLERALWLMVKDPLLTAESMADLIAFVQSSGPPPKKFDGNQPEPVTTDASGTLKLLASNAEIYGKTLVFEAPFKNLGYWGSVDDRAVWTINVTKPGKHSIRMNYACDNNTAGNEVVFEVAGQSVKAKIASTGTWENYQTAILGDLDLPAGEHRLTVRAADSLKNHLMDLREIRLQP